jgi:hypothetical protein
MSELALLGGTKACADLNPEYFDFKNMNLPEAARAYKYEAVWLEQLPRSRKFSVTRKN